MGSYTYYKWCCKKYGKISIRDYTAKKFGYSRQTVRTALQELENEGLIKRVRGSGTYVSYEGNIVDADKPRIGLLLSYYSDYLFPMV